MHSTKKNSRLLLNEINERRKFFVIQSTGQSFIQCDVYCGLPPYFTFNSSSSISGDIVGVWGWFPYIYIYRDTDQYKKVKVKSDSSEKGEHW